MAVIKIWPVRGRVESPLDYAANEAKTANPKWNKSSLENLTDVMHYVADEDKTEKQFFVSGVNCNPAIARDEFVMVKKQFDKEDGIVAYHGYQSFAEGEVTPEEAHAIGVEFARKAWGDKYQVLVATHLNTGIVHNHMVINSVSFKTGKKFQEGTWWKLKEISDEICREHGLSVVEHPKAKGIPKYLYDMERQGGMTRKNIVKVAVDEALAAACNTREFEKLMKSKGYICDFNTNHKHWTVRQKDWKRSVRLSGLGEAYTKENILKTLSENDMPFEVFQTAIIIKKQYRLKTRGDKIRKVKGLKGLYLQYCYLLGYLPKYTQRPTRVSPALRDNLAKLDMISEEAKLLSRANIETREELAEYKDSRALELEEKTERRDECRKIMRRKISPEEKEALKLEVQELNVELKTLRKELRLIGNIEERSVKMQEKLKELGREEVKKDERRR